MAAASALPASAALLRPRASARPFGPKTRSATIAITNASGAPTPRKDACTSCGNAQAGQVSRVRKTTKRIWERNQAGAPGQIWTAAASARAREGEGQAGLRGARHAAQGYFRRPALPAVRDADSRAQQQPCRTGRCSRHALGAQAKQRRADAAQPGRRQRATTRPSVAETAASPAARRKVSTPQGRSKTCAGVGGRLSGCKPATRQGPSSARLSSSGCRNEEAGARPPPSHAGLVIRACRRASKAECSTRVRVPQTPQCLDVEAAAIPAVLQRRGAYPWADIALMEDATCASVLHQQDVLTL